MPWPFRRRRPALPSPGGPSEPAAAPITLDDLDVSRRLTARPGSWLTLDPLRPAATGAAAPIVGSSASFIADLAGTHSLLNKASLREVSPDGPRGVSHGLAEPIAAEPQPSVPDGGAMPATATAEAYAPHEPTRRPVVANGPPPHRDLTSYVGELQPADTEDSQAYGYEEMLSIDDDIPEELPPPIFTSILAERTGRDLAELRPDLALSRAEDDDTDVAAEAIPPSASDSASPQSAATSRRHSLAESRRLGLGAPMTSRPLDVGHVEHVEPPTVDGTVALEPRATPEPMTNPPSSANLTSSRAEAMPVPEPPRSPARRAVAHYRTAVAPPSMREDDRPGPTDLPPEVRTDVTKALGRDPGAVRIHRDDDASVVAARIGARAFTRQGEVFLPMEAGPLDAPETRALLAHELTHVVQQRVYGSTLPRPSSPEGVRLEAEAHAVERVVRGDDAKLRVAPIRTLRSTPGLPQIDSGGFLRPVTEQLIEGGTVRSDDTSSISGSAHAATDEWRAPSDGTGDDAFQLALENDQRATLDYESHRGSPPDPAADRAENDRHLSFVQEWRNQFEAEGGALANDAQASIQFDQTRAPGTDGLAEARELERHAQFVRDHQTGTDQKPIVLGYGGLDEAVALFAHDYSVDSGQGQQQSGTGSSHAGHGTHAGSHQPIVPHHSDSSGHGQQEQATGSTHAGHGTQLGLQHHDSPQADTGQKPIVLGFGGLDEAVAAFVPQYSETSDQTSNGAHAGDSHHPAAQIPARGRERTIEGTDPTDVLAHLDEQDLEDLTTLLFERMQTRLRRDLLIDRERSGFLTDFR